MELQFMHSRNLVVPRVDHLEPIYGNICKDCFDLDPKKRPDIDTVFKNLNACILL